jgi:hypothetical protein
LKLGRWKDLLSSCPPVDKEKKELVAESLNILSLFKKECCPKWRLTVMKKCLSSHGDIIVR